MIWGRAAERAQIDELLASCRSGRGGALVFEGEAGIGKTALLEHGAEQAAGFRILRSRGIESESRLPFRGLWDLLRPILNLVGRIPPAQAASLRQALALATAEGHDRFRTFVACHSLLVAAAEREPLLLLCDDAQWLDVVSAEALLFTMRRIGQDPIIALIGTRSGEDAHLDFTGVPVVTVTGLDRAATGELLTASAGQRLSRVVEDGLFQTTAGNPLAMIEIVSLLNSEQLAGEEKLPQPIPAGQTVVTSLAWTLRTHPANSRRALSVAAASDSGELRAILAALHILDLAAHDLRPLEDAGVITIDGDTLEFRHPLHRSAAYQLASAQDRRAAHRALAQAMTVASDSTSRAWHLAAAAIGPDESVASLLEVAAADAQGRGDPASAGAAFEKAAALTLEPGLRVRRRTAGAAALAMAGRIQDALRLFDRAAAEATDSVTVAEIQSLRGMAEMWTGSPRGLHDRLVNEARAVEETEPAHAASMLSTATIVCYTTGEIGQAVQTARLTRRAQRRAGAKSELSDLIYCMALLLAGHARRVRGPIIVLAGRLGEAGVRDPGIYAALTAQGLVWLEQFALARATLTRFLGEARDTGAIGVLAYPLTVSSELEFRSGAWAASYVAATEAVSLATELKQRNELSYSLVTLARVEAAMGLDAESIEHCAAGVALARELGTDSIDTYSASLNALRSLGNNDPGGALEELVKLPEFIAHQGLGDPNAVQWRPDLVEAAILCGESELALRQLEVLEAEAQRTGSRWAAITAARCRGLLAEGGDFERHFNQALGGHAHLPAPFEDARALLSFGRRLRRAGRRSEAREQLAAALTLFESLGARSWATSTHAELAATGIRAVSRTGTRPVRLTAQEMQVALLVAEGASNKDAAARMFLSARTIESHLRRIFVKLGLRSRTELVLWIVATSHGATVVGEITAP